MGAALTTNNDSFFKGSLIEEITMNPYIDASIFIVHWHIRCRQLRIINPHKNRCIQHGIEAGP